MLLLTLSAFAFAPVEGVPQGIEPSRVMRYHQERQADLRTAPSWQGFTAGEGLGWTARFDEQQGVPYRAWGPGIDLGPVGNSAEVEAGLRAFFERNPGLIGVDPDELVLTKAGYVESTQTWYVHFDRLIDGVPLYRGGVEARIRFGRLVLFGVMTGPKLQVDAVPQLSLETAVDLAVELGPVAEVSVGPMPPLQTFEGARLVVLPLGDAVHLAWEVRTRTEDPVGLWVSHVDAHTGELLNVYNEVRFFDGTLSAVHDTRTVNGDFSTSGVPLAKVESDGGSDTTDLFGAFSLDGSEFTTSFSGGSYLTVRNQDGGNAEASFSGDFTWTDEDATQAEIDTWIFAHQVRLWGQTWAPDVGIVTDRLRANVNLDQVCNAYYDGSINFYQAGSGCNNTGRIADVVYHEWGHGLHYTGLESGEFDGSMSEGIGDVVSALNTGDSTVAPYFMTNGAGIRELEPDRVYPDDLSSSDVHSNGLIFAGAVWDLWKILVRDYGDEAGYAIVNRLFVAAIKAGPTIPDVYDEFVVADDDDGDLGNGTPHLCQIIEAFEPHGLGPGSSALLLLDHEPLGNQSPTTPEYPVTASVVNMAPACMDGKLEKAVLHYSIDDGDSWSDVELNFADDAVDGAIPQVPAGSIVLYWIEMEGEGVQAANPAGGEINPHRFYVGELEKVICYDFEADDGGFTHELVDGSNTEGADDWQHGTPAGMSEDPDFCASGKKCWGNDLGGGNYNGEYQAEKTNRLSSPQIPVEAGRSYILTFKRWLSVEDGYYDRALVRADGEEVWANHASGRNGEDHHIDEQWALSVVPVTDVDGDGALQLAWELESDQGLTFGGWNIDDVCVYAVPGGGAPIGGDDSGGAVDTGGEDLTGGEIVADCGCASGAASPAVLAGLLGVVLARRRRS